MSLTPDLPAPAGSTPAAQSPATGDKDVAVVAGRGVLFIGFAKIFFILSGSVQQFLLPRVVGAAERFGAFGVVNNLVSIVNNTMIQATVQSVAKFTAEDDARAGAVQRAAVRVQIVLGLILGGAFFLGAPLIAAFEKAPSYARYLRIAAAIPFLYAIYAVFVGSANGLRRFRIQATFDVTFASMKTVLLLGLAVLWTVSGAFAGFATAAVIIVIISSRVMRLPPPPAATPPFPASRLIRYMVAVGIYTLLLNIALNYDQPLLHRFAGEVDPSRAPALAGHYQGLRTLALLPYQALLVITFVIFPLVSRATFAQDREATRTYVTQTLRYALILVVAMALVLATRPAVLLGIFYPADYGEAAPALPILVSGECCLALLAVGCAILNAAGNTAATVTLMAVTVAVGAVAAALAVPRATPGTPMLVTAAGATSLGMAVGFVASLVYLRARFGGNPPLGTVARVAAGAGAAVLVGRFLPAHGKILGLVTIAVVGVVYLGVLVATGEFGPADRAKFARVLRR
jgi:O-antigen/teichoic acid export membrane protein